MKDDKELFIPVSEHGEITIYGLPLQVWRDIDVIADKIVLMNSVQEPTPFTDADYRFIDAATKDGR